MTKDWKYILYLACLGALLAFLLLSKNKEYDWSITLAHDDKNPYGTYALNKLMAATQKVENRYETFYELKDSLAKPKNLFILAQHFEPDTVDTQAMLNYVYRGGTIFISANSIRGKLADTLDIQTKDYFFENKNSFQQSDSTIVHLCNTLLDTAQKFYFRRENIYSYLLPTDSLKKNSTAVSTTIIAKNEKQKAVAIKVNFGKGYFVVSSLPLVFTNIYLLKDENHQFISALLSYLPQRDMLRTEYYQLGRMETASPLRFILLNEPLRWAYYITIVSILIFIVFEAKRKQRIIPIVKPPANTTLEFVNTIAGLYYESKDHKSIALKKISFFQEALRSRYYFTVQPQSPAYVASLALKTGADEQSIQHLADSIRLVLTKEKISAEELTLLTNHIQKFWNKQF
ncbi:MAG: DUF4350 domain-containing protein [Bacteroidetes bacterium]|nr:DUF4350 domain-containing protein [Bacteroidota bacterium]MBS1540601.1 DUF4350 domain-containing protein [Bacteroidota bacterium]